MYKNILNRLRFIRTLSDIVSYSDKGFKIKIILITN